MLCHEAFLREPVSDSVDPSARNRHADLGDPWLPRAIGLRRGALCTKRELKEFEHDPDPMVLEAAAVFLTPEAAAVTPYAPRRAGSWAVAGC